MDRFKIGVVMVTHNNVETTCMALDSILGSTYSDIKIVVVDNGSFPEYRERLQRECVRRGEVVEILSLDCDRGYSGACNRGARLAIEQGCELILFLNNDIVLDNHALASFVNNFKDESTGVVTPKVYRGLSDVLYSAGGMFRGRWRVPMYRGRGERDRGQYDTQESVSLVDGCIFMIRASSFEQIQGFDESLFYYREDEDLSYRLTLQGTKMIYDPQAKAFHWPSTTSGIEGKHKFYYWARNRLYFQKKHAAHPLWLPYTLGEIFWKYTLCFGITRVLQVAVRQLAVLRGVIDFVRRRKGRGPY